MTPRRSVPGIANAGAAVSWSVAQYHSVAASRLGTEMPTWSKVASTRPLSQKSVDTATVEQRHRTREGNGVDTSGAEHPHPNRGAVGSVDLGALGRTTPVTITPLIGGPSRPAGSGA